MRGQNPSTLQISCGNWNSSLSYGDNGLADLEHGIVRSRPVFVDSRSGCVLEMQSGSIRSTLLLVLGRT